MTRSPWALKERAQAEAYDYFHRTIRPLPKSPDGKINPRARGLEDNDIDAFRHAYVSGVFTQEYGETAADIFGRLNEFLTFDLYSNSANPRALNMDLWNNQVGRKYGRTTKNRKDLLNKIRKALRKGELIESPSDKRDFKGTMTNPQTDSKTVVVLSEATQGRNELFYDTRQRLIFTRLEFVAQIRAGRFPSYGVRKIGRFLVPVSNPDSRRSNNLG